MANYEPIDFNIITTIAQLDANPFSVKSLALVSWKGAAPKLDLRSWRQTADGPRPGKGVTLTDEEARTLLNALRAYFGEM